MALPKTFTEGEVLTAADLNGNFQHLDQRADVIASRLYAEGTGGGSPTTSPVAPTSGAQLVLPAGTWDIDYRLQLVLSLNSAPRDFTAHLSQSGVGDVDTSNATHFSTGGSHRINLSGFIRFTTAAQATLYLRGSASATGGTMGFVANQLRAVRVED